MHSQLSNGFSTKSISITSGKGGVGKTTLVANLSLLLADQGKKILILDADFGMANVDIFFGVRPQGDISQVLRGEKKITEVMHEVSKNIFLIPGGSGLSELSHLTAFQRRLILDSLNEIPHRFDYLFVDTAPGISNNVLQMNSSAQDICVIITPDPSSFTDAYGLIKVLHQKHKESNFSVVCNMVKDESEGLYIFRKFEDVVHRFMNVGLDYYGAIPLDVSLRKATHQQRLIVRQDPSAPSALAMKHVLFEIQNKLMTTHLKSGLQYYFEQVVGMA